MDSVQGANILIEKEMRVKVLWRFSHRSLTRHDDLPDDEGQRGEEDAASITASGPARCPHHSRALELPKQRGVKTPGFLMGKSRK